MKTQADHAKNMEIFNTERIKLEKDLKDKTQFATDQKNQVSTLK